MSSLVASRLASGMVTRSYFRQTRAAGLTSRRVDAEGGGSPRPLRALLWRCLRVCCDLRRERLVAVWQAAEGRATDAAEVGLGHPLIGERGRHGADRRLVRTA